MQSTTGKWTAARIRFEDTLIICQIVFAAAMLIESFMAVPSGDIGLFYILGRMEQRLFSVVNLVVSFQLRRRKRAALNVTLGANFLSFILLFFGRAEHPLSALILVVNAVMVIGLWLCRRDFCVPSAKLSVKRAAAIGGAAGVAVFLNAAVTFHFLDKHGVADLSAAVDSVISTVLLLFGGGPFEGESAGMWRFESLILHFTWACFIIIIFLVLQPGFSARKTNEQDLQHARTLLRDFGQNPCSYLTLEKDKLLYFGSTVDGVIPYGIVGDTIVVNGDPICAPADFPALLREFKDFCVRSAHNIFFLSVTDMFLDEYKRQGFGTAKCGEEARFKLSEYSIAGKKGAKMRMNINHAEKAGIVVREYKPLEKRDPEIEKNFDRITNEWLQEKKSGLLTFTMGTPSFDQPFDRRYFYAVNAEGRMEGYIVYVPFLHGTGYMADVTRRAKDAPGGVMEKIMYDAFQVFLSEGYEWASLGNAPLAGLAEEAPQTGNASKKKTSEEKGKNSDGNSARQEADKKDQQMNARKESEGAETTAGPQQNAVEKMLRFVYEKLNACYGFKDLYRAKEKYNPYEWLPEYYVFLPKIPTPQMFYAVVRIQNPGGLGSYAKDILESFAHKKVDRRRSDD